VTNAARAGRSAVSQDKEIRGTLPHSPESVGAFRPDGQRTFAYNHALLSLGVLILILWLASEIVARDLSSPASKDPYRLDRWRNGEGDPDQ